MHEDIMPRTEPPSLMLIWADVYLPGNSEPRWLIGSTEDVYAALDETASASPWGTITLAQLNDAGVPFGVIADIIDAKL